MPRYSLKRLFASTTLIATGLASVIVVYTSVFEKGMELNPWVLLLLWFGGGMMIGAGAFVPFRMTLSGIAFGFIVQGIMLFAVIEYAWRNFV